MYTCSLRSIASQTEFIYFEILLREELNIKQLHKVSLLIGILSINQKSKKKYHENKNLQLYYASTTIEKQQKNQIII